ncbi:Two-component response regulator SSK1p [Sporothrix stenoceras]|uniref:Two-component response regulator SSK1p n=1 Tax=Sporothrix stenoceras TaxID=5173 RepID=A0ABR3Z195_9PEZI
MATPAAQRKVWVRRPGASATLVAFNETDVVDDVREMLLRKYGNSLGRVYDAPDVILRLNPREAHQGERTLGPDELMTRTLDVYYPGGQTIEEALVIDVPIRRVTPNASPRGGPPHAYHLTAVHHHDRGSRHDHRGDYSSHSAMAAPDYFGPGVVPDYYNHGALTAESEYSQATLAPESALTGPGGARGGASASSQHLYPPSPSHLHPTHKTGTIRSATGGAGSGVSAASLQGVGGVGGGGGGAGSGGGGGSAGNSPLNHPHSISILATGQAPPLPNLPSPGGSSRRSHKERPKIHRQLSSVPDDGTGSGREGPSSQINGSGGSGVSGQKGLTASGLKMPIVAPIPGKGGSGRSSIADGLNQKIKGASDTNGVDKDGGKNGVNGTTNGSSGAASARSISSPPRPMSPMRGKRAKKSARNGSGLLNGSTNNADDSHNGGGNNIVQLGPLTVPPINVLIVEDNIINLKLLEAFVKRLKVRWQTAMNGRDAVAKWRTGGFHLVLMDIQLPLMSGLDATREIRRLERVNSIGVFASTPSDSIGVGRDPQSDKLANMALFKSPVIIVALTASSLQSDRNDALAAGCNDFLTKPVNFLWLEKKIMEWGCMQALIDFDGWRKWKEQKLPAQTSSSQTAHADGNSGNGNTGNNGSSDATSSKKSKKSSGHSKRPSMSLAAEGESSETTNTVSSTESPGPGHTRTNSGSVTAGSPGRSPLSKPSISERLAAATAAVEVDNAAMDSEKPEKKEKAKK